MKWGLKLFVLCDSVTGYTYIFEVYLGAADPHPVSRNGVTYDVVMRLMSSLLGQGYHVYMDNFYTSGPLFSALYAQLTPACGTLRFGRAGFPDEFKDWNGWSRQVERGDRYVCINTSGH